MWRDHVACFSKREAEPSSTVSGMSDYTIIRRADAPDYTGDAPGAFLGYGRAMELEQVALNVRVLAPGMAHVPPGTDAGWGHNHRTQEEIYFVLYGAVTIKLGDDVHELGPLDAARIAPETGRAVRNHGDEEAAFIMCSIKIEDAMADAQPIEEFWT
jgi:quercetin dioxygenase-like cupin family protein